MSEDPSNFNVVGNKDTDNFDEAEILVVFEHCNILPNICLVLVLIMHC